jgi:hypothetical protein
MSHFAKVENNIVIQVIVAEQDVIDSGLFGDPASWIQTSYNTRDGVHILGGTPLRKNFAGIGYIYDPVADEFLPPYETASHPVANNDVITITEPVIEVIEPAQTASDTVIISAPTAFETILNTTASDTINL